MKSNDYNTETIAHLEAKLNKALELDEADTSNKAVNIRSDARWAQKHLDALKVSCPSCKAKPGQVCIWRVTHSSGAAHRPRLKKAQK